VSSAISLPMLVHCRLGITDSLVVLAEELFVVYEIWGVIRRQQNARSVVKIPRSLHSKRAQGSSRISNSKCTTLPQKGHSLLVCLA
jgi:hypothetical protein